MNKLYTNKLSFENDVLPRATAKKLVNIVLKKLKNKFNAAKISICKDIYYELKTKQLDIESKINELNRYVDSEGMALSQFKDKLINPRCSISLSIFPQFNRF